MPSNERRRQKAAEKQAAKRKQRTQAVARASARPVASPRLAAGWPLHECLISRDWRKELELVQVVVARKGPGGMIGAGVFLMDLGCLGAKNGMARSFPSQLDYEIDLRDTLAERQPMVSANLNLAAKIVREGIAYARSLGFQPHRDVAAALPFLGDADPDAVTERIPLGKNGKPFYFAGPYDNPKRVIDQLARSVGVGNFDYVVPLKGSDLLPGEIDEDAFEDDDEFEDDEPDDQPPPKPIGPGNAFLRRLFGR